MSEPIRLQKYFTDCGVMSRRAAEAEIAAGLVRVNGSVASVGDKIDPDIDVVEYKGRRILPQAAEKRLTVMLNKPRGYVTTVSDEKGRHTVTELVAGANTRLYPIGRLDMDSEGLLLLTNDGELANRLTHPRHEIPKIYHVTISSKPTESQLDALCAPMELDGYKLLPIGVRTLSPDTLELMLHNRIMNCLLCVLITGMIYHLIHGILENIIRCLCNKDKDNQTGNCIHNWKAHHSSTNSDQSTDRG